ncbi:unnamed protein product [Microthlaspi erraticum]|uniref:Integrase catalytic domain-containing protein n=1 Tax=Microthlaspi erraticum TaxID=1685480 RepID=A0A6D2J6Q3_9BRAS|nr:unnamed protein product [Microthlaspi erraticum]
MDTGATNHVTADQGTLRSVFNTRAYPPVKVGNGSYAPVTNLGNGSIPSQSRALSLQNVLVCPSIIKNLISVRRFSIDNKCSVEFDPCGFVVKDLKTRTPLLQCDSPGPLYAVTPSIKPPPSPQALITSSTNGVVWHRRLGHPGNTVLQSLASYGFLSFNKTDMTTLCHACQTGKNVRLPFTSSSSIITKPFEIVHSDIWTSPVSSFGGIKFYVIFVDQFSNYVWAYPLRRKSENFSKYLHFSALVRNQFRCSIKSFQCDNGGEYNNRLFLSHLAAEGTQIRFSCPYTSQQNGRAERMLLTINNLIRAILFQAHMKPEFWVEALHTAVHILNLLPSSSISNEIPFTKLFSKPASYDHLRVFGCLCYPNLFPQSQHKLAPRSTACVFLGYPTDHGGYRCLDLVTKKIIFSRHVRFDENLFPFQSAIVSSSPVVSPIIDVPPSIPRTDLIPVPETPPPPPLEATPPPPPPPPPLPKHSMVTV